MNQETLPLSDLFRLLNERQVESVLVEFAGSGDSGDVEEVQFSPASPKDPALENALVDLSYDLISEHFSGYENNEGGKGSIEFEKDTESGEWSVSGSCLYAEEIKEEAGVEYSMESVRDSLGTAFALEDEGEEPSLMAKLAAQGVREIDMSYAGYGDQGGISECDCRDEKGETVDISNLDGELLDRLHEVIGAHHSGFENEEGGGGSLNLQIDHQGNLEEVEGDAYFIEVKYGESYTNSFTYTQEELIAAREQTHSVSLDDRMNSTAKTDPNLEP